jgi:putative (di)nucleoside polyphosphate hydrolase
MRNKFKAALSISVIKRLGDQLRVLRLGRARLAPVSASLSQAEATTAINSGNDNLPFRPGVGIMLFNAAGEVWVGRRTPKWLANGAPPIWQMPQGGINPGEPPERAARRELEEETGIRNAEIVGEIPAWLTWELPDELLGIALKGRYRGQCQRWFAMRFEGPDSAIDISGRRGQKREFDAWKWVAIDHVAEHVASFKRDTYHTVVREFQHLAG